MFRSVPTLLAATMCLSISAGCAARRDGDRRLLGPPVSDLRRVRGMGPKGVDIREAAALLSLRHQPDHLRGTFHLIDSYNDIALIPGSPLAMVNGRELELPWAPYFYNGSLRIPDLIVSSLSRSEVPLGSEFMPREWYVQPNRSWQYIVIHHSATAEGGAERFHKAHAKKWKHGLGYHFVIGNGTDSPDGKIEVGGRWLLQNQGIHGAHAGTEKYNEHGIGICLVGDFDGTLPTERQMAALVALVRHLQHAYQIPSGAIIPHSSVRPEGTHCPGGKFPWSTMFERLKSPGKSVHAMAR